MVISIKNAIILLNGKNRSPGHKDSLVSIFPLLDLYSDIYVVSENFLDDSSRFVDIVRHVAELLAEHQFYRINLRPLHSFTSTASLIEIYTTLHYTLLPFMEEAYRHQSISRLMIFPVIQLKEAGDEKNVLSFLKFLRERNLVPSLYLQNFSSFSIQNLINTQKERVYIEHGEGPSEEKSVRTICCHLQCDDLLAWVNTPVRSRLPEDRTLIFSEKDRNFFAGLKNFLAGNSLDAHSGTLISEIEETFLKNYADPLFHNLAVLPQLKETFRINNRKREAANIFFSLGLELVKREDYAKGLEQFEEVLATPSGIDDQRAVLLSKALCHLRLHDFKSAQAALDAVEKEDPTNAMVHYYQGHLEFGLKDYIEAIDRFKKAIEIDALQIPAGDAYYYMALSHINILEYDDALTCLAEAEKLFSQDKLSPIFYYYGICFLGKNDLDTAYQFFQKALCSHPDQDDLSSIYLHLGICHKEKGDYLSALDNLKKAREAEEDRVDVHNLMGFCCFKLKDHDQAIACFLRAVEIDSHSAIDWANLGVNVRAKGEDEKAIILFKKALGLDPTIGFAQKHLRELLEKKNR
ncbi:MAG TPA: tetratricopeptide repeat protein [Thermodesulfobacteriota bacterium]|nr:tetratricopeptide repeat protein [Thermodesulfobacteriota bacterium]